MNKQELIENIAESADITKEYLEDFNLSQDRSFNKITFKNFINDFFSAYAG